PSSRGEMGSLLRSPHIGGAEREMTQRALVDYPLVQTALQVLALFHEPQALGGRWDRCCDHRTSAVLNAK
ncbi:MAG: hypothetical protein ACREYE_06170, partial [Gammaproteobacteria bacterium]